ncbi:MAG: choice-of-anchor B family protein [Bacteroidota bacterium]
MSALFCTTLLSAQLNMTLRSEVTYPEALSDIWGYHDGQGREYALVGLNTGVNIQDVTDPDNLVDMGTARGAATIWRDIKAYAGFAYITNEASGGLMVIDLRGLPTPITDDDYYEWTPNINGEGNLRSCHNIYIDEFGYGYLSGCNLNDGGIIILDLFTTPGTPIHVTNAPAIYSHDVYTRENIMYSSDINDGFLSIYDVSDKNDIRLLNTQVTPSNFTHNAWLSDDGNTVFTTDERPDAPVAAYDVTDPMDIVELDQYRPIPTIGEGVIPHNVHVWKDWLIISYYTDGCIIVDGSRPTNLIEVGNFDTWIPNTTGFDGVWGAYPFLPSETILASDIGNGLYVFTPNYKRACWLEGKVTDADTGMPLNGVSVLIDSPQENDADTDFSGDYQTGIADAGTYEVTAILPGYFPFRADVELENGVVRMLDIELEKANTSATGRITDEDTGEPIPFAAISIDGELGVVETEADGSGAFTFTGFIPGDYTVLAAAWGHQTKQLQVNIIDGGTLDVELKEGYYDDFALDLGWQTSASAVRGLWERGEPQGTTNGNVQSNPEVDLPDDFSDQAYVTGNGGGGVGDDDIDGGIVRLTSPSIDISGMGEPILRFHYWFYNAGGNGVPDDFMTVYVQENGQETAIESYAANTGDWEGPEEFDLRDFVQGDGSDIRIIFEALDTGEGHLVESAIDGFSVLDDLATSVATPVVDPSWTLEARPSTFSETTEVQFTLPEAQGSTGILRVLNAVGQQVDQLRLEGPEGNVRLGAQLERGIYFVQLEQDGVRSEVLRVVKAQ